MSDPTLKAILCPKCGTPAAPGENFCRNCGTQLFAATSAPLPPTQIAPPAPTITAPPPAPPSYQAPASVAPPKKRSKLMLGCLVIIGLLGLGLVAGGGYVWYRTSYTPPVRQAPAVPERAAGTLSEFPVDKDTQPTSVETEALGGTTAKSETNSTTAKLPPGVTKSSLAKGATAMTSSTYKKIPAGSTSPATGGDIYINVLTAIPGQTGFVDGIASSIKTSTGGTMTSVTVQSPKGATYAGSHIVGSQGNIYVLAKQGADIVIVLYGADPSVSSSVDNLAKNVGNGEGLIDYPETKESLWTLPAQTPSELTLVQISTITGAQIESSIGTNGDLPSEFRPFIPDRLTAARYNDSSKQEWAVLNLQYGSSFQAWRTWLLARSALGLGGGTTTTVRDVDGIYLNQEGKRVMLFQKGPYLIFMSGPTSAPLDRFVALGNQIQV
ncbi:MAG TPA: zinc ribbon domain-containing protein [Pyrinomonadaceae bacterium]|nr:zinc ribbon domain-containing protein [Pyrinomonadaceae bacterium]